MEGTVTAHRAGYGFVRVEGLADSVFLPPAQMRGVMHGDRVRVSLARDALDRWVGQLDSVVGHAVNAFLGTLEVYGKAAWVTAADRRLQLRCSVAPSDLHGARNGDWVIARIVRRPGPASPGVARIEKRLDPDRPVELATESAIARFDLPCEFPAAALREAQAFGDRVDPRALKGRVDLRDMPLVTIDGESARDFDDAVYAEPHPGGFRLVVAIADVSHYVRPGTELDRAAQERGTSVYFPTRVLPMLPTALSDHLCSLAPHVDRLCFAADMIVSRRGALKSAKFYPAVMRSAARLTYSLVNEALFEGRVAARREIGPLVERLLPLVDVYRALHRARMRRGALDFDAAEAEFQIDSAERVRAIVLRVRNDAHRLIEECMILANVAVARELKRTGKPTLYRVHGQPEEQKLDRLTATLVLYRPGQGLGGAEHSDGWGRKVRFPDPAQAPNAEVNGAPAWFDSDARWSGLTWQYAPDAYAGLETNAGPLPRQTLVQIAEAVRFVDPYPARVPYRLDYLPAGLRPYLVIQPTNYYSYVGFVGGGRPTIDPRQDPTDDDGDGAVPARTPDITVTDDPPDLNEYWFTEPTGTWEPITIAGRPALCSLSRCNIDYGEYLVSIGRGFTRSEMELIVAGLHLADPADPATWFAIDEAIPGL